jgi:solute carrier family 35, member E3
MAQGVHWSYAAFLFITNILIAVVVVGSNKQLFLHHNWRFPTLLTLIHFLVTIGASRLAEMWEKKDGKAASLPTTSEHASNAKVGAILEEEESLTLQERLIFGSLKASTVLFMNLSLMTNQVGFYQLFKLMGTPMVALMEFYFLSLVHTPITYGALGLVVMGVAIIAVSAVEFRMIGAVFAFLGTFSTASTQVYGGYLQKHAPVKRKPLQILKQSLPFSVVFMVLVTPFMDDISLFPSAIASFTGYSWLMLSASCFFAFLGNVSSTVIVGVFSALTFQALGHLKTISIVIVGIVIFGDILTFKMSIGCILAITGLLVYSNGEKITKYFEQASVPVRNEKAESDTAV